VDVDGGGGAGVSPTEQLKAPFPWFGGKSRAAHQIWAALGDVTNYVEPFGGSAAALLARPNGAGKVETYNDADGMLVNVWRAIQADPVAVAVAADWPVSEVDLHARHLALVEARASMTANLMRDPHWFDAKLAGWWIWGTCAWIGSGFCSGRGPWVRGEDGYLVNGGNAGQGINRQLPHLGDAGQGINRQLPHLGDAGQGINRQLPHLGNAGRGILQWLEQLATRLRGVRITCGDWRRVVTPSVVERHGLSGVLYDPPYPEGWDTLSAYSGQTEDASETWEAVIESAIDLDSRGVRVVVCGYSGLWSPPEGWTERRWTARKGYAADGGARQAREVLWCSPACIPERHAQVGLFGGAR
jgi:hypothetical protein